MQNNRQFRKKAYKNEKKGNIVSVLEISDVSKLKIISGSLWGKK